MPSVPVFSLPYSIDGALAMSTPGSGLVSLLNQALDAAFVARALLAPDDEAAVGPPPVHHVEAVQEGYFHELRYLCASGPRLALRAVVESLTWRWLTNSRASNPTRWGSSTRGRARSTTRWPGPC
jgi:hypothetical protein